MSTTAESVSAKDMVTNSHPFSIPVAHVTELPLSLQQQGGLCGVYTAILRRFALAKRCTL